MHMCVSEHGDQKKASDPLELELQVFLKPPNMDARNLVWILWRAASVLNRWAISLAPIYFWDQVLLQNPGSP